jgi:hypothetical protein
MPDLVYGEQVQSARTGSASQTNALAVLPIESPYTDVALYKPYCTISDVKQYIRNSEFDDGFYAQAINQASRLVDKFTQKEFWYHNYSQSGYRVYDDDILHESVYLPFPIRSINKLVVNGETISSTNYHYVPITTKVDPRNYSLAKEIGASYTLINTETDKRSKVLVYGTFGYAIKNETQMPTDVNFPPDIRRACTMMAGTLSDQFRKESIDQEGNRQNLLETNIPYEALELMKKSKRVML